MMTHEGSYRWGHDSLPSGRSIPFSLRLGPFILGGHEPVYDLLLIDVTRRGVYVTFARGTPLVPGTRFNIVRPIGRHDDPILKPGQPRRIVAEVEIIERGDAGRALVRVLGGSVISGTGAEKKGETVQ